ncbi:PREDICTED: kinesin-like protein Klp61F [Nicrophorus vespilloides]|uniref:Kinesin-like protein Klp61F n=1 Tax=Nicrophorus vespilloides TaxID=110193 RepID=A0ABM1MHD0_NICVS|nr:PREDICTED: kinesin-like protein Klp61F [Nicrophorus vespilloides]
MEQEKTEDFVNVAIRVRPNPRFEEECLQIIPGEYPALHIPDRQQTFSFDNIFSKNINQFEIYNAMVKPLVLRLVDGYNSTVFAYGQTGTGKTYTIGTNIENYNETDGGLIMRALNDLMVCTYVKKKVNIQISFYEIYNEKVYDLLTKVRSKVPLAVKGFNVVGLSKNKVDTLNDALILLSQGCKNRHTGDTRQNSNSSRSHAIFSIFCHVVSGEKETEAKLNLVDLAGCESIKKTGNFGVQFHEGISINKGLLNIGQVINALSTNQDHIPYRQSIITTILKDSLSKSNYITFIACVRATYEDMHETMQTLEFAQRAKKVKNRPELNTQILEQNKLMSAGPRGGRVIGTPKSSFRMQFKTPNSYSAAAINRPLRPLASSSMHENVLPQFCTPMGDQHPLHLSPIIMRCMDRMEDRILGKLETIVTKSIQGGKAVGPQFEKENLQMEVSKMVRNELQELKKLPFRVGDAAGANIVADYCQSNEKSIEKEETYMDFYNNIADETVSSTSAIFKVPQSTALPKKKLKTSSPISKPTRRSTRLSIRGAPAPQPKKTARRSLRLEKINISVATGSDKANVKNVMQVLNTGSQTDLLKLHTIGVKSAQKLIQFREIKGKFKKLSDLEEFPWRGTGYERFLQANFLN